MELEGRIGGKVTERKHRELGEERDEPDPRD